jgi:hypothetical protein
VNRVRAKLVEQAGVVRDSEYPKVVFFGGLLDASTDYPKGVNVEPGIELVEDGEGWSQYAELQGLITLLLAPRQIDVQRTLEEFGTKPDAFGLGLHTYLNLFGIITRTSR